MATTTMRRYLVKRNTGQVYIWTEALMKRGDLEEVWADSPKAATSKQAMPDPKKLSLHDIETMTKADLLVFANVKLGLEVEANLSKSELADVIKETIFTRSSEEQLIPTPQQLDKPRARAS